MDRKPTPTTSARRKRRKRLYDEAEYGAFVVRAARNFVKRAVDGGSIDSLRELKNVSDQIDDAISELVRYLRSEEGGSHSWAQVAEVLGITRQAAQQRFGGEGARTVGGQPAHLR